MNYGYGRESRPPPKLSDVATTLPKDVRNALVQASQEPNPLTRTILIDEIVENAKMKYPRLFIKE